jgi:HK97 family phage major capsid protein
MDDVLKRLMDKQRADSKKRDEIVEARKAIVEAAKSEHREDLDEQEDAEFRARTEEIKKLDAQIADRDARIEELAGEEERGASAAAAARRLKTIQAQAKVKEERTYQRGNGRSYLQDLAKSQILGDDEARSRLARHAEEVKVEDDYAEYRDLSRTDGAGGFFVPPKWLMDQWIELSRASRATANLVTSQQLPAGTDSINIPKVATGTSTAIQPADNDPVVEVDLTDTSVVAPVRTIAGQQDVAIQLLDQSPVNFDEVIFRDLLADYAHKTNLQVLGGSGVAGQVTGIFTQAGTTAITWTEAAPTVAQFYAKIADAIQRIHVARFQSPEVIVMHPRRWAWLTAAADTTGRPLVVPTGHGPTNAAGLLTAVASQQVVGTMQGLPVVTDPSIPLVSGQDQVLVMRASDLLLYESSIRTRVLPETLSGTLTVRLQVYGYVAFTAGRYPQSVTKISGTGLAAPTF